MEAWIELAELVGDQGFRARAREMAVVGAQADRAPQIDPELVSEHACAAVEAGIAPESAAGQEILARIVGPEVTDRADLADRLATFSDRRVERYWHLLGVLNGWERREPQVPVFEWIIAALRAS